MTATRGIMKATAGTALASIPELVEMILLELPFRDVLRAQQVNSTWQGIVKGSPKLQQALFMRPSTHIELRLMAHEDYTLPACTSLENCRELRRKDSDNDSRKIHNLRNAANCSIITDTSQKLKSPISINPFLRLGAWRGLGSVDQNVRRIIASGQDITTMQSSEIASWRKMLLTQPPVQSLLILTGPPPTWHVMRARPGALGVTLLDLQQIRVAHEMNPIAQDAELHLWSGTGFQLWSEDSAAGLIAQNLAGGPEIEQ